MKILLITVLCAICFAPAYAGTYESPFGFSIVLPSYWSVVTMENLKNNPEKYYNFDNDKLKGIDKRILEKMKKEILEQKAEIYENSATSDSSFRDNINVTTSHDGNPKKYKAFEKSFCDSIHDLYSKRFGRDIKVYGCKSDRVSNFDVIYSEVDGVITGTRLIQYVIWKPSGDIIIMTLACKNRSLSKLRKEFTDIINSFKVAK